jgi:hypothetical protein
MKYIIYRISVADYTYIGSTLDFKQRKSAHKSDCKSKELKIYQVIKDKGGWDNCEMVPIEEYECENNTQARIREEYWRREYDAKMNSIKAYRTEKEKEDYRKQHYINNKETLIKDYTEKNKEHILCWHKDYYNTNKNEILEKMKTKYTCECGSIISKGYKSKHLNSKKHLAFVASNTNQECIACDNACDL